MAKVDYIKPIEALHGKLSKDDNFGFARRNYNNANEERVKYTQNYGKRSTARSASEISWNTKFGAVCKMARLRMMDATKYTTDMAAFKAQSTYKTFRQYVWHKAETEYDNATA